MLDKFKSLYFRLHAKLPSLPEPPKRTPRTSVSFGIYMLCDEDFAGLRVRHVQYDLEVKEWGIPSDAVATLDGIRVTGDAILGTNQSLEFHRKSFYEENYGLSKTNT